jgi:hypothetical protein
MVELAEVGAAILARLSVGSTNTRIPFPWPVAGMVKMPGALCTIGVWTGTDAAPFTVIITGTFAEVMPLDKTSNGTCALTYGNDPFGVTDTIGAEMLLKVTLTPLRELGSDAVLNVAADVARGDVKIATRDPGATGVPLPVASLAKLAAFSTHPLQMLGTGCAIAIE